jgi:hypothetical protein
VWIAPAECLKLKQLPQYLGILPIKARVWHRQAGEYGCLERTAPNRSEAVGIPFAKAVRLPAVPKTQVTPANPFSSVEIADHGSHPVQRFRQTEGFCNE